jgi:uncharacterized coiled-coil protein SlyX
MTFWHRAEEQRKRIEAVNAMLDTQQQAIRAQTPRVNALVAWLEQRKVSNGFGVDFEWTLAHPRASGGKRA